jgi:ABC-2 type transport system permease protein
LADTAEPADSTNLSSAEPGNGAIRNPPLLRGLAALRAIVWRDLAEFGGSLGSAVTNLVVPTILLFVVAAGFNGSFGRALIEPYDTYVTLSEYLVPGLVGMVLLVAVARSILSLVSGQGAAAMRFLSASPLPRWLLTLFKLISVALLATIQAAVFVVIAYFANGYVEAVSWLIALPAAFLAALMIAAVMLALLVFIRQLRSNWTAIMYVVLPALFLSSALYPLWKFPDYGADYLRTIALANPFTHAVETIRFASERHIDPVAIAVVFVVGVIAFAAATFGVDPRRKLMVWGRRRHWTEPVPD